MYGGGILYENGIYYWFGEYKIEGEVGNLVNVGVYCYLFDDLYYWKDCGIVLLVIENDFGYFIFKGCIFECFKVIYNFFIKKYVMWFYFEFKGVGYLGVLSGIVFSDWVIGFYIFLKVVCFNVGLWFINVLFIYKIICRFFVEEEC